MEGQPAQATNGYMAVGGIYNRLLAFPLLSGNCQSKSLNNMIKNKYLALVFL